MTRLALLMLALVAHAQDTRNVAEPVIPPACAALAANLTSAGGKTLAEADETKPDTRRIQQALDSCGTGRAVVLKAGGARDAFLSGPLQLREGVALVVDAGAILFGSRNPRDYDVRASSCGVVDQNGKGCRALINGDRVAHAAVMGGGVIDGRGWAALTGTKTTWWDLAEQARAGGKQNCPRLVVLSRCDDFTLYRITLKNPGNFHVYYDSGNGFTAWGVVIDTPARGARNTDGIDPSGAANVTITHCFIHAGDDNVAIKAGAGRHSSHITIAHNHFYAGHGMSIGSETEGGAEAIRVSDLSVDGADNAIRIKSNSSKGGLVRDVVYEDVCVRDTKNPILMDSDYEHFGKGGSKPPTFTDIALRNVRVLSGGTITLQGFDEKRRLGMTLDRVYLDPPVKVLAEFADFTLGPGPVNFVPAGRDVRVNGKPGQGTPNECKDKFAPMPRTSAR